MSGSQKNPPPPAAKTAKKKTAKRQTERDLPQPPTAKEIEQSISGGKSSSLEDFMKGLKL